MVYNFQISCLAQGKDWDEKKSPAQNYIGNVFNSSSSSSYSSSSNSYQSVNSDGYQGGDGYQNYNTQEFRDQKEAFFNKKQNENSMRPE